MLSPEYAAPKEYEPAPSAPVVVEAGTAPPTPTVTFCVVDGEPVQVPFDNSEYVTVPDGVNPATPVSVAVSKAADPVASVPFQADPSAESFTTVPAVAVA